MKQSARSNRTATAVFLAACAVGSMSFADLIDTTWLGGTGSWNDPTKWSGGVVPDNSGTTTFRALVPSGSITTPAGAGTISLDSLLIDTGASVRLNSLSTSAGSQVNGTLTIVSTYTTGAALAGGGTLDIGVVPSFASSLRGTGSLEIGEGLTVVVKRYNGRVMSGGAGSVINRGRIVGGDPDWSFSPSVLAPVQNLGTIEARNGALNIGGTFTRADLGNLAWSNGGTITIFGTFLNTGQTLNVDAAHAWGMQSGTIVGGTINVASDTRMNFISEFTNSGYTLDDVVINGPIRVSNGPMVIKNGTLGGNLDVLLQVGYIAAPPKLTSATGTLTIASTVNVHGASNTSVGDNVTAIVNHGTIRAESFSTSGFSPFDVVGTTIFNHGTMSTGSFGTMGVTGNLSNAGQILAKPNGLLYVKGTLANTGTIDVSGAMAVDYTAGNSPITTLASQLRQGYHGGAWDGPLINSSAAAARAGTGVGIIESSDFIAANGTTTFAGRTIDTSTVLLKYTYYGDTDLNGIVNFDDYSRTDSGFNNHKTGWFNGDFDYNGVVDFDDYSLIDLAFNTQSGTLRRAMSYLEGGDRSSDDMNTPALRAVVDHYQQFGNAYASGFLNAVPEPSGIALIGATTLLIGRRRRHR